MPDRLSDADVIYRYTRKQAIDDGVLINLAPIVRPLFSIPVAMTCGAFAELGGQKDATLVVRAARILRRAINKRDYRSKRRSIYFLAPGPDGKDVAMWSLCHGGDNGEPVLTIMLEGED